MNTERARMVCNAAFFVLIAQLAAWSASAALEPSANCRVDPHAACDTGNAQQSRALLQGQRKQSLEMPVGGPFAMTEAVKNADRWYRWDTDTKDWHWTNPKHYKETVDGLCLKIIGVDDCAEVMCECPGATSHCSKGIKNDYSMGVEWPMGMIHIEDPHREDPNYVIFHWAFKFDDPKQQGTNCTTYGVRAGMELVTEDLEMEVGQAATFSIDLTENHFEVFVGLFSKARGLVDYKFMRGVMKHETEIKLPADLKDTYHLLLMTAGYDGDNDGLIDIWVGVTDVKVTKASPTPIPTPQPTPAPTVPSHAASAICVKNTQHGKPLRFRVKHGSTVIHKSQKISNGGTQCVDIKNLVADLETVQVEIFSVGLLAKVKTKYSVTKHSQGTIWTRNCKKWSTKWECYAE